MAGNRCTNNFTVQELTKMPHKIIDNGTIHLNIKESSGQVAAPQGPFKASIIIVKMSRNFLII